MSKLEGIENTTFTVRYVDGVEPVLDREYVTETTITILEKHIECPLTPNIPFKSLKQILINNSQSVWIQASFALVLRKNKNKEERSKRNGINKFNFVANNKQERKQILQCILVRMPPNCTNRAHLKTIQSATKQTSLIMRHDEVQVNQVSPLKTFGKSDIIGLHVRYMDGVKIIQTTMNIFKTLIECPKIGIIQFHALREILINDVSKEKYKGRSFTLILDPEGATFQFMAKNKEQRQRILQEILSRFPVNNTNREHLETIQSGTDGHCLIVNHVDEAKLVEVSKQSTESNHTAERSLTFRVRHVDGWNMLQTSITVKEEQIECPKTSVITIKALHEILLNTTKEERFRNRSFALTHGERQNETIHFVAKNKDQRDMILKEILKRVPWDHLKKTQWESIQSATEPQVLVLSLKKPNKDKNWITSVRRCTS